jgi:hypothetical protein
MKQLIQNSPDRKSLDLTGEVEYESLMAIIRFLYSHEMPAVQSKINLLTACHKFEYISMFRQVRDDIIAAIDSENALQILRAGELLNDQTLKDQATNFFKSHPDGVLASRQNCLLFKENTDDFMKLYRDISKKK